MKPKSNFKFSANAIDWLLLLLLSLVWGFSFFFMKRGLESFSAYQVGSIRIFMAFVAFLPMAFIGRYKVPRSKLPYVALMGLCGSTIPPFLFATAQTKIDSGVAGILNSLTPVFVLLLGIIFFGVHLRKSHVWGVLLGLVGATLIIILRYDGSFEVNYLYALLVVLATFLYGVNANLIKLHGQNIHPLNLAVCSFLFIGPFAGIHLFSTDFVSVLQTDPTAWTNFGYLVLLAVFGTAYSLVVFNLLTQRTSALFAAMVTYLIPIVAIVLGFLDGEKLGWPHLLGMSFILSGVYLTGKNRKSS